jgi:hypothetical protein
MDEKDKDRIAKLARQSLIQAWRPESGVWSTPSSAIADLLPIPVQRIAERVHKLSVEFAEIPQERAGFETSAMLYLAEKLAVVSESLPVDQRQFAISHEIGHFV